MYILWKLGDDESAVRAIISIENNMYVDYDSIEVINRKLGSIHIKIFHISNN